MKGILTVIFLIIDYKKIKIENFEKRLTMFSKNVKINNCNPRSQGT